MCCAFLIRCTWQVDRGPDCEMSRLVLGGMTCSDCLGSLFLESNGLRRARRGLPRILGEGEWSRGWWRRCGERSMRGKKERPEPSRPLCLSLAHEAVFRIMLSMPVEEVCTLLRVLRMSTALLSVYGQPCRSLRGASASLFYTWELRSAARCHPSHIALSPRIPVL